MKKLQMYPIIVLLLCLLVLSEVVAQEIQWTKFFGGTGDDGGESMVLTVMAELLSPALKAQII